MDRKLFSARARSNAGVIYDLLGTAIRRDAIPGASAVDEFELGRVSLWDALQSANLTGVGAEQQMMKRLPDDLLESFKPKKIEGFETITPSGETILSNIFVPRRVAQDVAGAGQMFTNRAATATAMEGISGFYDSWLNFFKGHATAYWPAFIGRNGIGGQLQNQFGGAYDALNPFARDGMATSLIAVNHVLAGGNIPNVLNMPIIKAKGITDPAKATRYVITSISGTNLGGRFAHDFAAHMPGSSLEMTGDLIAEIPGMAKVSLLDIFKKLIPGSRGGKRPGWLDPRSIRGVGGRQKSEFALMQFGEDMNYVVETYNRFAPALAMMWRGMDPSAAARRVNLLQVNYRNIGQADPYIRRAIPFFSFIKGQTTYLAQELTQKPGGGLARVIRTEAAMQREGLPEAIPEHIRQSAAIPFGKSPGGGENILTSLGLMHEDPLQFFGGVMDRGPGKALTSILGTAGQEAMSRLAPQIATPIELATGASLWQSGPRGGRALHDQYGQVGGLIEAITGQPTKLHPFYEQLPQVTGAGRWISSIGKAIDPRKTVRQKALNLLTGARLTTVSPEQQAKVIDESIKQTMTDLGARQGDYLYFPKWETEKMSPEEQVKRKNLQLLQRALQRKQRAAVPQRAP